MTREFETRVSHGVQASAIEGVMRDVLASAVRHEMSANDLCVVLDGFVQALKEFPRNEDLSQIGVETVECRCKFLVN